MQDEALAGTLDVTTIVSPQHTDEPSILYKLEQLVPENKYHTLSFASNDENSRTFEIGRKPQVPNHLKIDDSRISTIHCRISACASSQFKLEDLR